MDDNIIVDDWRGYLLSEMYRLRDIGESAPDIYSVTDVSNLIVNQKIVLSGKYQKDVKFTDCIFKEDVHIMNSEFLNLDFSGCSFEKNFTIGLKTIIRGYFSIVNVSVDYFMIVSGEFDRCSFNFQKSSRVSIAGNFKQLLFGDMMPCKIDNLKLNFNNISGDVTICNSDTIIDELSISNSSRNSGISIENISVCRLHFNNFRNDKSLRLLAIKPYYGDNDTELSIVNSYMGKAEFYNINFNEFKLINIYGSHLVDCSFVNVKLKYEISSFENKSQSKSLYGKIREIELTRGVKSFFLYKIKSEQEVREYYGKVREVYRQIKFALSRQGDIIHEQKFHSKEMLAHSRTRVWEKHFFTKLIIKFSYWFSDFGQSIWKPLRALFIGHWILVVIAIYFGSFANLKFSKEPSWSGFEEGIYQFFHLINPLRRPEETFHGYLILVDLLMRIWSSYMIYNIIRASRRFIK